MIQRCLCYQSPAGLSPCSAPLLHPQARDSPAEPCERPVHQTHTDQCLTVCCFCADEFYVCNAAAEISDERDVRTDLSLQLLLVHVSVFAHQHSVCRRRSADLRSPLAQTHPKTHTHTRSVTHKARVGGAACVIDSYLVSSSL